MQARRYLFSNIVVFYTRTTTCFPQTATWPALAPKSSRDLPDTSQRAPQEPQRFHVRYLIHPLIGLSLIENRIPLLVAYTRSLKVPSKMVFGHNLRYMAPFGISRTGFCMVFQPVSFFFHAQGQIFEPRIGFLDPGSTFWPGDLFGVKNGSPKK